MCLSAPQLQQGACLFSTREINTITTFLSFRWGINVYWVRRIAPYVFAVVSIVNTWWILFCFALSFRLNSQSWTSPPMLLGAAWWTYRSWEVGPRLWGKDDGDAGNLQLRGASGTPHVANTSVYFLWPSSSIITCTFPSRRSACNAF